MKIILFLTIMLVFAFLHQNSSYADNTGSITVQVKDTKFETSSLMNVMYFLVYQDFSTTPFKRIDVPPTNPYTIPGLPLGHHYTVEVYVYNVWSGVGYADLQNTSQNLDLTIPLTGGMRFNVFYNDNTTPMPNAHVTIQSQDGKTVQETVTDALGNTPRYWLQTPSRVQDYYIAHITIVNSISYDYSPIRLVPGISQDFKIQTPWPPIVSNLITTTLYNDTKKISNGDGKFFVELYNETGLIGKSGVDRYGNAHFSNLKVDKYMFKAFKISSNSTNSSQLWGVSNAIINGSQNSFAIYKGNIEQSANLLSRTSAQSCECVAFRLDDIQDYFLRPQQEKVMDIFLEKKAPLTVGVIGSFFGKDKMLLDYLQTRVKNTTVPIEIANHGWIHENFALLSETEQSSRINQTNQKLQAIFGFKPTTLLMPLNSLNNDTIKAALMNGMTHVSSSNNPNDKPPYPLSNQKIYRFPETAYTARLGDQGVFVGTTHDYVFQQIQKNMNAYGFAVIMMHPQDFSLVVNKTYTGDMDWIQLYELRTLIDEIRNSGLKIVTVDKINIDAPKDVVVTKTQEDKSVIPVWLKSNSRLWEKDQISDSEFINAVQYLIKEKIIILENFTSTGVPTNTPALPWMKNNAGLWADGQISKKEFAGGINYLITSGTITP